MLAVAVAAFGPVELLVLVVLVVVVLEVLGKVAQELRVEQIQAAGLVAE